MSCANYLNTSVGNRKWGKMPEEMFQKNQVDVVILSWNRVESTIATLDNIFSQVGVKFKIWIIDQASNEKTIQSLRAYARKNASTVELVELKRNLGVAGGRNHGMRLGNAEFVVCIDNDAIFETQTAIADTAQRFRLDNDIAVIGYKIKNYFTNIADRPNWAYPRQLMNRQNEEFLTSRFCGAAYAIRRSALEKTLYYDDRLFFYWEELDLSYQLINLEYKIIYYPEACVLHKVDPEQRVNWKGNRYYYLVRNALYLDWKYYRSLKRQILYSAGYFVKGVVNGVVLQFFKAIVDAVKMSRSLKDDSLLLHEAARDYIFNNDVVYRGSLFERLKREVFERLN